MFGSLKAQDCDRKLDEVQYLYEMGRLDQCIDAVNSCIKSGGYSRNSKIVAYGILAKSYLAIDSIELGYESIREILSRKDDYEPDISDPMRYRVAVALMKADMKSNVIMSVSKKAEKLELAPATIVVMTAEDIEQRGYINIDEILNDLPGVDVAATGGLVGKSFNLRGYRSSNMSDKVMIVFDGVEDNEMYTQFGYIGKQLPIQSIKRVELIYGPASSLYGANAFSGVLNIVTKDGSDLFIKKKNLLTEESKVEYSLQGKINSGSFNTNALEMTGAVKLSNGIVIQANGKYHVSDENNLSAFDNWDGKWTEADFGENHYLNILTEERDPNKPSHLDSLLIAKDPNGLLYKFNSDSTLILPTQKAIDEIAAIDQKYYHTIPNIAGFSVYRGEDPTKFSDPTVGQYFNIKVTLGDLILEAQLSDRNEGASPDYIDQFFAVNSRYTNWQARQQFISSRYSKKLGDRWFFYNTAYYRISDFGNNSRLTTFNGFAQGKLSFQDYLEGKNPYWRRVSYFQQCKQFRDEFRAQYQISDLWDMVLGAEVRNGVFQSNYLTTSTSDNAILNGTVAPSPGGNNPAMFDLGLFGQVSYSNPQKKINVALGGRWDKNVVAESQTQGYSQVNPRFSAVYYPGKWIFKAIYSEAIFAFPSFVKFSSSVSRIAPDDLDPEKVRNAEISISRTHFNDRLVWEGVVYNSQYDNMLTTNKVNGLDQYGNALNARIDVLGSQWNIRWKLNSSFNLNLNATVNHSNQIDLITGNSLKTAQVADYTAFGGVTWLLPKDLGSLFISSNFVGVKYTGAETTIPNAEELTEIPAYKLINASLRIKAYKNIALQIVARNILDELNFAPGIRSAAGSQSSLIPQAGRNIHIAMDFKF